MAVKNTKNNEAVWHGPPPETIVDVVSTKGTRVIVTPMRYDEALKIRQSNKGWINQIFQQGYHSYKTTKK